MTTSRRVTMVGGRPGRQAAWAWYAVWVVVPSGSLANTLEQALDVHGQEPTFNDDGVDLSQIRRALALTPIERLRVCEGWRRAILRVRQAHGR